jgi:hypothetical protein
LGSHKFSLLDPAALTASVSNERMSGNRNSVK